MSDAFIGTWLSRIIRLAMAASFGYIAHLYDDLWFLYIFAGIAFITGFMVPKRCLGDECQKGENKN